MSIAQNDDMNPALVAIVIAFVAFPIIGGALVHWIDAADAKRAQRDGLRPIAHRSRRRR